LYSYISQISGFGVPHWEKNYIFLRLLNRKLPKEKQDSPFEIDDVDLVRYKIQKTGDSKLTLEDTIGELDPMSSDSGGGKTEEPLELLSQIIQKVNDTFGGVFTKEETTNLVNITQKVFESDDYKKVFNGNNSDDVKKDEFVKELIEEVTDYHDKNIDFYKKVMNEKYLGLIVREVFNQLPRFLK
jgi:type I restriction enzyme R subunit